MLIPKDRKGNPMLLLPRRFTAALLSAGVVGVAFTVGHTGFVSAQDGGEVNRASFNNDGTVNQPVNWRSWVFVGAPLTPNLLNGGEAAFPEYHNVYIEPSAFEHWSRTGEWADGTQFAKELVLIREGDDCVEDNQACFESSGLGYFQGEFAGLELKVRDAERFAGEPGNWAYFSFGHQPEPYEATAAAFPTDACNACHEGNAADDFVFTQYYPVLRAAKP
ncbi:MAG: cytochrome P460 family protein [Pseudomonadota bacterium]